MRVLLAFLLFAAVATAEKSAYQKLKEKISNHFKDGEWTRTTDKNKHHCLQRCDGVAWKWRLVWSRDFYQKKYDMCHNNCIEAVAAEAHYADVLQKLDGPKLALKDRLLLHQQLYSVCRSQSGFKRSKLYFNGNQGVCTRRAKKDLHKLLREAHKKNSLKERHLLRDRLNGHCRRYEGQSYQCVAPAHKDLERVWRSEVDNSKWSESERKTAANQITRYCRLKFPDEGRVYVPAHTKICYSPSYDAPQSEKTEYNECVEYNRREERRAERKSEERTRERDMIREDNREGCFDAVVEGFAYEKQL
jgi:hypothetical protein